MAMVLSLFGIRASKLAQVNSVRTERGVLVIAFEEKTEILVQS
jgi:hypothetical protein